jgi:hypothetical protein
MPSCLKKLRRSPAARASRARAVNSAGTARRRVGRAIHGSLGCALWAQDIQDMQDDFWRRNGFDSYEESSGERQEAHWDAHVPDPDTGEWAMPRGYDFREMSMSSVRGSRRPPAAGDAAPLARLRAAAHCCSSPSGTSAPPLPASPGRFRPAPPR